MRNKIFHKFEFWAWCCFVIYLLITILINYAGAEGFNPTDEGVILAQSWRMLNGQIPHHDFISIRPVFSGILHSLHFALPFPLLISSRYFVLFQFFVMSYCVVQMFRRLNANKSNVVFDLALLLIVWMFSVYNYNLYSWTTIDALFWSALGFNLIELYFIKARRELLLFAGLTALIFAMLSRQTFAVVVLFAWLYSFIKVIRHDNFKIKNIWPFCAALLPLLFYLIVLAKYEAIDDFISQLSGRTEFYQVAIKSVVAFFIQDQFKWFYILLTILLLLGSILKNRNVFIKSIWWIKVFLVCFFIAFSIRYFSSLNLDKFTLPYMAFWMLSLFILIDLLKSKHITKLLFYKMLILGISWVSLISLGDNTPIFAFGLMTTAIFYSLILEKHTDKFINVKNLRIIITSFTIIVLVLTTYNQRQVNYRDTGKKYHTHNLNSINSVYGNISTNKNTWCYLNEIDSLISKFQNQSRKFCFIPDNPAIYPLYKIQNPLSIDWPQMGEITSQLKRLENELQELIKDETYFVVQKYYAIRLSEGNYPINENEYPYLIHVKSGCQLIDETPYFYIYSSN